MHNNYYFLKFLVAELRQKLCYARLKQSFSQEKDELMLGFERQNGEDFWIKCYLGGQFSSLVFLDDFRRAGRNSVDLFSEVLLAEVQEVELYENERAFSIHFLGGYKMLFKLFGNRGNVLLFRDDDYQGQFQKKLKKDQEIVISQLSRPIDQSFEAFLANQGEIKSVFPTFAKEVLAYLQDLDFESKDIHGRWGLIEEVLDLQEKGEFKIYLGPKGVVLSLVPMTLELLWEGTTAIEALNQLFYFHWSIGEFEREKNLIISNLEKRIAKTSLYLQDLEKQQVKRENSISLEEIGHILMANLHAIQEGVTSVTLDDFYRNQPIQIKLNAKMSPIQNAENYYRKAKNFNREVEIWQQNWDRKQSELLIYQRALLDVQEVSTKKGLKPFATYLKVENTSKEIAEDLPYAEYECMGWDIWVGKSAKTNDLLTFKHAKKTDFWLHARDVPGSHVIIRNPQNKPIPKPVIERAASLAAYYSKRQHEKLVPVQMASRKYIRKTKDLAAGQVIVEREEVVMVEPLP
ncbi:DUF814 domain-containing protein [Sandaracinomonas limnophila]|uniref:DUF814 domain-containing protein n=1 Tax=Sandaracinomonas limnophila TaxID=1862386 RepID=A0A437PR00_9BACT|nr:NFACT RNA binding domain-containing protein [Sandaracinomonas limnophila]RVU24679.1 DUF814 domain-containing protein [Sandaracinomonas limnophila]